MLLSVRIHCGICLKHTSRVQTVVNLLLVAVGIAQVYLWWVTIPLTKRTAEAAKESADTQRKAMLSIERPHLLLANLKLFQFMPESRKESDPPWSFEEVKRRGESPTFPSVTYRLKNYGKSPAWITRFAITFKALAQLPAMPIYDEQSVIGYAIPAEADTVGECILSPVSLTYEQRLAILQTTESLFVWGFVEYADIFKEKSHRMAFCWRWSGPSSFYGPEGFWQPSGPESYWFYY